MDRLSAQAAQSVHRLTGYYAIAQRCDLLIARKCMTRIGDSARGETHQPLNELRGRRRPPCLVQERWRRGGPSGDVFPSCDGMGVAPPAVKMSLIRDTASLTRRSASASHPVRAERYR